MVHTVDTEDGASADLLQTASGGQTYRVGGRLIRIRLLMSYGEGIFLGTGILALDVLIDVAAKSCIDDLNSTADPKDRFALFYNEREQGKLHGISQGGYAAALAVSLFAEKKRVGVRPAGKDKTVQGICKLFVVMGRCLQRKNYRNGSGRDQPMEISGTHGYILRVFIVAGSQAD